MIRNSLPSKSDRVQIIGCYFLKIHYERQRRNKDRKQKDFCLNVRLFYSQKYITIFFETATDYLVKSFRFNARRETNSGEIKFCDQFIPFACRIIVVLLIYTKNASV